MSERPLSEELEGHLSDALDRGDSGEALTWKRLTERVVALEAENARLRKVYEAAVEWVRQWDRYMVPDDSGEVRHPEEPDEEPLIKAVREARNEVARLRAYQMPNPDPDAIGEDDA